MDFMRAFILIGAVLVSVFGASCGGSDDGATAVPDSGEPREAQDTREAEVYAAVIRQLVTKDHTFGSGEPPFKVVYVLDGAVPGAADPEQAGSLAVSGRRFSEATKSAISSRLADLPPIRFVERRDAVVDGNEGGNSPGEVANGGVLIALGPIDGQGEKVEVESSLWMNGLVGAWQTYVVALRDGDWRVTGTRGPVATS